MEKIFFLLFKTFLWFGLVLHTFNYAQIDSSFSTKDSITLQSSKIKVQLVALSAQTGQPVSGLVLLIEGPGVPNQKTVLDSLGEATLEVVAPMDSAIQWVFKTEPSRFRLKQDTYILKPNTPYIQWTLEVEPLNTKGGLKSSKDSLVSQEKMVVFADRIPLHQRKLISERTMHRLEMREVTSTQNDPYRVLGTLPGISQVSDLSVRPYTRGGDEHETRSFWNGVPVLHPYHALSAYSIYNMEAIEKMTVYTGGFPAEGSNSLSGAIWMTSRPAPLDSVAFWTNMSLLKGHTYLGIPVVKEKFGVYIAYQAFWYDYVIKRAMDITSMLAGDSAFTAETENYKKYTDLPNFKDLELGFNWAISSKWHLDYSMIYAKDLLRILDAQELVTETDTGSLSSTAKKIDTLALVEIPNVIHGLNVRYAQNARLTYKSTLSWQTQDWQVVFEENDPNEPIFQLERNQLHGRVQALWEPDSRHFYNSGVMVDYLWDEYRVNLPRAAYEMLIRGSYDLMETVGFLNPNGYVLTSDYVWDGVGDVLDNIMIREDGQTNRLALGAWISDRWKMDAYNRLELGARLDFESASNSVFLSPRVSWFHQLRHNHELSFSGGLYHQDDFDFLYRAKNPELKSEKAWHFNAEYSWDISDAYRVEWNQYFKWYYDLVGIRLHRSKHIQYSTMVNFINDVLINDDTLFSNYADTLLNAFGGANEQENLNRAISYLPEEMQNLLYDFAGEREVRFSNLGHGFAIGSELSLRYHPLPKWRGWLSAEISLSKRKDDDLNFWYNFRNHRPWAIKWHNYVDLPSNWEYSLRIDHSAGLAYTGFTNYEDLFEMLSSRDTLFVIERKNNRRYMPTTRLDMRLERNSQLFGHPFKTYFEIWNMFNSPNFILRDSESGALKWFTFSYPFPVIFSGIEFHW